MNSSYAQAEARGLLKLLDSGETIASIRTLIGMEDDFRKEVRLRFDVLVVHSSPHDGRLLRNARQNRISSALKKEICRLLRAGWSHSRIRAALPVGYPLILQLSKELGAPYLKQSGRGRRFTASLREQIRAAVQSGRRSADIEREFQIDYDTVLLFRRELGDFEDRRHWKKMSSEQIDQATEALKNGRRWRDVASDFNVTPTTLQRWVTYRKRKRRPESVRTNG
jgi:hypothetical protein